jgi:hypothetical protein
MAESEVALAMVEYMLRDLGLRSSRSIGSAIVCAKSYTMWFRWSAH